MQKNYYNSNKFIIPALVIICFVVNVLSAVAASRMFRPNNDLFTSELGKNLAILCGNSDCGLSSTQISMIEHAFVKSIRYDNGKNGEKKFYARLAISPPDSAGKYSNEPEQYLIETAGNIVNNDSSAECELIGLCRDNAPVVDKKTIASLAQTAELAWSNESLTSNKNFEYALTDMLIPEPFRDRKFTDGNEYQGVYSEWLDECAARFESEGMTVTTDSGSSGDASDIRAVMEQIITPYLCSVRNISLSRSEKNGYLTLSFDSLDVIGTLSAAKKPSISAINKLSNVYTDERALKVSIDIDLCELARKDGRFSLSFFNIIRAITRYGSTLGTSRVKIKTPESAQVIAGKSDGQWPIELKRAKGDGSIVVSVIRVDDSGKEKSVLKVYLTDGSSITVCLSKGKYRLNYAIGSTYYGGTEIFGDNGIYFRDEDTFYTIPSKDLKTITVEKKPAESLSFRDYLIRVGTDKTLIDRSQFIMN